MTKRSLRVKYRFLILIFVLLTILITVFLFPKHLYKEEIIDADILIVEGWLPEYAIIKAIEVFNSGEYEVIVTTGDKLPADFNMHSYGALVFDLNGLLADTTGKRINTIKVNSYGSKAAGEYPHFQLYLNDSLVGNSYVDNHKRDHVFNIEKEFEDIKELKIKFDNDGFTYWRDRNLFIEYVIVEDIKINSRSKAVYYDIDRIDGYEEFSPGFNTTAEYSAFVLRHLGFTDSLVSIPVLTSKISRTFSCASAFRKWYSDSDYKNKSVNVLSLGPHTRRTWMIYKKVLGKNTDVGIILVNSVNYDISNWWKSVAGIKATIHEMVSYIYTIIVLPFITPLRTL